MSKKSQEEKQGSKKLAAHLQKNYLQFLWVIAVTALDFLHVGWHLRKSYQK